MLDGRIAAPFQGLHFNPIETQGDALGWLVYAPSVLMRDR